MKNKYKNEELLESLPDYINNTLDDKGLKKAIQMEIDTNPDFNKEFDSVYSTIKNVNRFSFTEPPESYFNSLLTIINEKIYKKSDAFSFFKSFSTLWKLAIPIVTIIIFFISYKTFFKTNEYTNRSVIDTQIVTENKYLISPVDSITSQEYFFDTKEYKESTDYSTANKNQRYIESVKKENSYYLSNDNRNSIYDLTESIQEDDIFFSTEDEGNIEQEFDKLSVEEQNNIISKIKNSNL